VVRNMVLAIHRYLMIIIAVFKNKVLCQISVINDNIAEIIS
jgi:hypothetical protein